MKQLSIIVPTYNMEKYLDKCLTSLIIKDEALFRQLEVLVVIDGATDRSSEIAHVYQSRYPDVFITVDKENGNYGSCVNRGIQIATGKYVKILDADDSFDTANFEDYMRFLNEVDVDMVITPYVIVNEKGELRSLESYDLPAKTALTWGQMTPAFMKKSLQMHAVTYKLQNIRNIKYKQTEGISYTDQEWIFTPLTAVDIAIAYPNVIYRYLVGRTGQTMSPEIFQRNIAQNERCCRRIVLDYSSFKDFDGDKQEFIDYKFMRTIKSMYDWYLLSIPGLDIRRLIEFDDFLNSVNASYITRLDNLVVKYTHYHYIRRWHQDRLSPNKLNRLLYWYTRLVDKIMRSLNN